MDPNGDKILEIKVIDTGIGIREQELSNLFKMFGYIQDRKNLNK